MAIGNDLNSEVGGILRGEWSERAGRVVPESADLGLGNDAVTLEGTVLYADLDDSTELVDTAEPWFAAEIYKSYLACAARIIRSEGAVITSYDGDRIMAVFIGDLKLRYTTTGCRDTQGQSVIGASQDGRPRLQVSSVEYGTDRVG